MSRLKLLGTVVGGGIAAILLVAVVIGLGAIVGGVAGATVTLGYNVVLGTSFSVAKYALIGSIVGVASGVLRASASAEG